MLKVLSISLALAGFAAASIAAGYWWKASRLRIPEPTASIVDVPAFSLMATQHVLIAASRWNSVAAVWTGLRLF
jgi:hypothetical protein